MPLFTYKALRKEDNTTYESTIEAKDRFEVYNVVRKEGGQVISVSEKKKFSFNANIDVTRYVSRIKDEDRILFMRNLGAMLHAGLPLVRALNVIERQTRKAKIKDIVTAMIKSIEQGGALSVGMEQHPKMFSGLVISMVRAGEESGSLIETLKNISDQLEQTSELKKKVRGAMLYPLIVVSALLIVGVIMLVYIVPTLTKVFTDMNVELPFTTRIVVGLSDFLATHFILGLLIAGVSIGAYIAALRTERGKIIFESIFLRVPVIGQLMREVNSARTGRTLASLLSAGVSMLAAMDITCDVVQNRHFRTVLEAAKKQVEAGKPLAEVFTKSDQLYPPLVGELIAVGEETGALPDMLREVATYYEKEVEQKTKNMSAVIEPFLMLIVGGGVGFFAVSMISPIYSITSNIQ